MDIFIESARHRVFSDACEKSPTGRHHVSRLFSEMPHLGCKWCRRRNRKVRLRGLNLYNYLVSVMRMPVREAAEASGHFPPSLKVSRVSPGRTGGKNEES